MRWALTKRFWNLCKSALPEKDFWLSVPFSLPSKGGVKVYEQTSGQEIGEVKFTVAAKYGKTIVTASINGLYDEIAFKKKRPITVKASKSPFELKIGEVLNEDLSQSDLDSLANIYLESNSDFEEWIQKHGLNHISSHISERLIEAGALTAKTKTEPTYKVNDRVRIDNPASMEHNEMGTITGIRGDYMNGWYYSVLVDGSSKALWFAKEMVKPNMAGVVPENE